MTKSKCINWQQFDFNQIPKLFAVATAVAIPISTAAVNVLFPLTIILGFCTKEYRTNIRMIIANPIATLLLVFFALFLIGTIYSSAPTQDIMHILLKYSKLLIGVFLFPLFLEEKWRSHAINAFIGAIFVMLLASYLKAIGWLHYGNWDGDVEFFRGHIAFNFLLSFAAYLLLLKIAERKRFFWLWILPLTLIIFDLFFMSIGRTGYFTFIIFAFVFFSQKMGWRGALIAFISCIIIISAAALFSKTFQIRMKYIYYDLLTYHVNTEKVSSETSLGLRIIFEKNSIYLIKQHPFFGTGTGSFKSDYAKIIPTPTVLTTNPHNEYLHITVQFGIVGLFILLLFFALQFRYSFYLPQPYNYIAIALELAFIIGCFGNSWLMDSTEGHLYVYFVALIFAALPTKYYWHFVANHNKTKL